jgi:hypothetical protein
MFYDRDGIVISEEDWQAKWQDDSYRLVTRTPIGDWEILAWWTGVDERGKGGPPKIFRSGLSSRPREGIPVRDSYRNLLQQFHHATIDEAIKKHDELVSRMSGDDVDPRAGASSSHCSMGETAPAAPAEKPSCH